MMENTKFDWYGYYELADSYDNENDPAKLRTGIGRFYYSSFLESRDYILNRKLFLIELPRAVELEDSYFTGCRD